MGQYRFAPSTGVRQPVTVGLTVAAVVLYAKHGWSGLVVPLVLASAVSALWRWRDEASWWRWCAGPLLGRFRQVARPARAAAGALGSGPRPADRACLSEPADHIRTRVDPARR
ncbi:hypothetical protein [Micromonospora sp. DT233]|uniref:hypothetical protein n=1 Tax=Micromonospora sp. DT233 TaxID=3393432 RepID=UPI003CEF5CB9